MSTTAAYDEFCTLAGAFAAAQQLPIGFPGVKFTPPATGHWLEVTWSPGPGQNYGLADGAPSLLQGVAQISVCGRPAETGLMPWTRIADAAVAAFGKGTTFGPVRVYRKPYQSAPITGAAWIMVPVTVMWQGFTA